MPVQGDERRGLLEMTGNGLGRDWQLKMMDGRKPPCITMMETRRTGLGSLGVLQVDEMVAKATIGDDGVFEAVYWRIVASLGCVLVALAMKDG